MPSPVPERNRNVYFVGAGLSCALGMPNTAALITDVKRELGWDTWRHSAGLDGDLIAAFEGLLSRRWRHRLHARRRRLLLQPA